MSIVKGVTIHEDLQIALGVYALMSTIRSSDPLLASAKKKKEALLVALAEVSEFISRREGEQL